MTRKDIFEQIQKKKTMLCVGLDVDFCKMPQSIQALAEDGTAAFGGSVFSGKVRSVVEFNKSIIDATAPYCVAYKPNLAFYECLGSEGVKALEWTVSYLRSNYPDLFLIADAKRGDIGNTASKYAEALFRTMDFDAVTVAPYMGADSVRPFLQYEGKWAIVLALTSNASAAQFQLADKGGKPLYQAVMEDMMEIATPEQLMFVVGATKADKLREIRSFCPDNFLLVPGVGAQGGSAEEVIANGANEYGGLLINSSRAILYASPADDYAEKAAAVAMATAAIR